MGAELMLPRAQSEGPSLVPDRVKRHLGRHSSEPRPDRPLDATVPGVVGESFVLSFPHTRSPASSCLDHRFISGVGTRSIIGFKPLHNSSNA